MMTAEEYIRVHLEKQITDNNDDVYASINGIRECMINFTTGHVKAALKAVTEGFPCDSSTDPVFYETYEDAEVAVLNAYPLTNIK